MRIFFTIIDDRRERRRVLWLEGDADSWPGSLAPVLDGGGDEQSWSAGDQLLMGDGPRVGARS